MPSQYFWGYSTKQYNCWPSSLQSIKVLSNLRCQYFAISLNAFPFKIIHKRMHIHKNPLNFPYKPQFWRKVSCTEQENKSGIMFALSLSSLHFWHAQQPPDWRVALYQTMSRLEPQVNNWHRHDPWHTMHGLLHQVCFCLRAVHSLTSRLHKKSVSFSVSKNVLTGLQTLGQIKLN